MKRMAAAATAALLVLGLALPASGTGKVTICHLPPGNPENVQTIEVSANAVPAHLAHGDSLGACVPATTTTTAPEETTTTEQETTTTVEDTTTTTILIGPPVTIEPPDLYPPTTTTTVPVVVVAVPPAPPTTVGEVRPIPSLVIDDETPPPGGDGDAGGPDIEELPFTGIEDHLPEVGGTLLSLGLLTLLLARGRRET